MPENLRNPGSESPKYLDFDQIPSLFEFLAHGGVPGVTYLYVAAENQPKAQHEGYAQIIGMPYFTIGGVACTLMAKGKPVKGSPAQPGTGKCILNCDNKVWSALGLEGEPFTSSEPAPTVVVPNSKPSHKQTDQSLLSTTR